MEIFKQIAPLKAYINGIRHEGKSVGFVPTMGALHRGHLGLIGASKSENQITIGSIYVNPTQFNNSTDLLKYPRILDKDTEMLEQAHCDVLFCPEDTEMYPVPSTMTLDFGSLGKVMEGQFRPGHFSGVAMVVAKLFNVTQPDRAYFGQKDWQQFTVISRLVEELKFNITLHSIPTLRDTDGLALSSRNLRLNGLERKKAPIFYEALRMAQKQLLRGSKLADVRNEVRKMVESYPEVRLEYFELADSKNLNLLEIVSEAEKPIMCIAGYVGEVRLIDNLFIHSND
jgi:pantoate--beta-alanine ligase